MGGLLIQTGDHAGALAAFEEQRELAEQLEAEHSTDAVQSSVASSHHNIARVFYAARKPEETLASFRQALAIRQKLADANPTVAQFQGALSLFRQGKPDEARQLATQAAAKMKPLPKDAKNLLASDHGDLILWLAYREAKDTIKFDVP